MGSSQQPSGAGGTGAAAFADSPSSATDFGGPMPLRKPRALGPSGDSGRMKEHALFMAAEWEVVFSDKNQQLRAVPSNGRFEKV